MPDKHAYVVFERSELWFLRFLKQDFRHVQVVLDVDNPYNKVQLNPCANGFDVKLLFDGDFSDELLTKELKAGRVLKVPIIDTGMKQYPWRWFSCVEVVKRIIGVHCIFVCTPWQLYKHLKKGQYIEFTPEDK